MRIGFEAKRVFHNNTGLGNYGRDVIRILKKFTPIDQFYLYTTSVSSQKRFDSFDKIVVKLPESGLWKKLSSIWRLGPVANQIKKDGINLYHGLSGEIPSGLKRRAIPTVVTVHDLIFFSHPHYYSFFDRIIYSIKSKHAAKNADKIIAISEQTKRDVIKYLKAEDSKIEVVYQGCNQAFKKAYPQSEKDKVREKYSLPEQYILNVGTLQERKNALLIVKAIKGTDYQLVLVGGEKKYAQKIHSYIKENNLGNQVSFLKNVSVTELAVIYKMATIFCYPSLCEGFGIPIIEALFSKIPVITSQGNCFPEAGGPNSVYIDPSSEEALREAFKNLYYNEDERKRIADLGYTYVQRFTDEEVAKNLFKVYKSML